MDKRIDYGPGYEYHNTFADARRVQFCGTNA